MDNRIIAPIDPEKLKSERRDVDLGSTGESEHNHVDHEARTLGTGDAPIDQPTSGATPPAR